MIWDLMFVVACALFLSSLNGRSLASSSGCKEELNAWLQHSLQPEFLPGSSELHLDWSSLEEGVLGQSCVSFREYQAELWVLRHRPESDGFGSLEYWSMFERCRKLSPESFSFHSSVLRRLGDNPRPTPFRHVIEETYILRICLCLKKPCSRRACFSLDNNFCSKVLHNPFHSPESLSPWCRDPASSTQGIVRFNLVEEHNCSFLRVSGEVQTCTPVQDYDSVEVTFRPLEHGLSLCPPYTRHSSHKNESTSAVIPLIRSMDNKGGGNYSEFTGYFNHYFSGLGSESQYCAQIEIKNNPYCQHEYVLNQLEGPPSVCNKYLNVPLRLSGRSCTKGALWVMDQNQGGGVLLQVILVCVGVMALLVILALLFALVFFTRADGSSRPLSLGRRRKSFKRWLFFMENPSSNECSSSPRQPLKKTVMGVDPGIQVLFIYFNKSREARERNLCLKKWIQSLVGTSLLVDLNDDENFEEMGCFSEAHIEELISRRETKVIIVNTPLILRASSDQEEEEKKRLVGSPKEDGEEKEDSPLMEDSVFDLKLSAIHFIKTNFYANYEKVSVINYNVVDNKGDSSHRPGLLPGSSITPGRNVTLPEHFNALRTWLQSGDGEFPRVSSNTIALQEEFNSIDT